MSGDKQCAVCKAKLTTAYVDGKLAYGPWADMCLVCHLCHGVGLGIGKGQKYIRQPDKSWKLAKSQ